MNDSQSIDLKNRAQNFEAQNELLLIQLHEVQEELEAYFLKCQELEAGRDSVSKASSGNAWVDDELPEALAEVKRLNTLAQVQAEIKEIENRNALNVKLGNLLLEGSSSVGGVSKLPFALLRFWRNATSKNIPAALGGKEFTGVVKAYEERGFVGVKSILKDDELSPIIKANAYTALARHLMRRDAKGTAEAASKAFELDPKPYRLKWLACRIHEAGDVSRAEALLDLLPDDTKFSESERNQATQIRYEAKRLRSRSAQQTTQIVSKQRQVQAEITALKIKVSELQSENFKSIQDKNQADDRVAELNSIVDSLNNEKTNLTHEKSALSEEKRVLLHQLQQVREGLESTNLKGQEKDALNQELKFEIDKQAVFIAELDEELVKLSQYNVESKSELKSLSEKLDSAFKAEKLLRGLLEHEQVKNVALAAAGDEQLRLAQERQGQIETLVGERSQLTQARDEALNQIGNLQNQLEGLVQEKAALVQESQALAGARDEQAGLAQERQGQIEALAGERSQLTQARDEALNQIVNLQNQLEGLVQEKAALVQENQRLARVREEEAADLADRKQMFKEEMLRAEAQIDLIKDMLLREPSL